jgi:hypothetical protein
VLINVWGEKHHNCEHRHYKYKRRDSHENTENLPILMGR